MAKVLDVSTTFVAAVPIIRIVPTESVVPEKAARAGRA
jgi:hypothetical protein